MQHSHLEDVIRWPSGLAKTAVNLEWFRRLRSAPPGMDLGSLADAFGVGKSTVHRYVHRFGYRCPDLRRRGGTAERWDDLDWSRSDSQLARELGVSRERVRQVRRSLGLPPSTRSRPRTLPPPPARELRRTA